MGITNYYVMGDISADESQLLKGELYHYAVANDREKGIYECY